ncbi:hypothetical protein ACE1CI_19580 [Aerosakkonemataceae cyanobacterium BLCC-F50]|uniref:Serine kinase n=1 Tax=Floridaenema flaviceps BLCC-F50 TaxID=3153642 RepID=A0ABV4XW21_9CYAN
MRHWFSYTAYGLQIRSTLPIPEFIVSSGEPDVVIRLGQVECLPFVIDPDVRFQFREQEACFIYEDVGAFLVQQGREIVIDPAPRVEERVLRLFILGPIIAMLLHQRGLLLLHASAVVVNNSVVAFLGDSGWGKSTTAAALHTLGYGILTDEILAIVSCFEYPIALPAFPQLKLWPEAAIFLGNDPKKLPRVHPQSDKRTCHANRKFPQRPLPLKRIYVLVEGLHQEIEPLQPQNAFIELVRHSYAARFLKATGAASLHLHHCAKLASSVSICSLIRPKSLAALPDLVRLLEKEQQELTTNC